MAEYRERKRKKENVLYTMYLETDRSIEIAVNETVKMKTVKRPNVKAALSFAPAVYVTIYEPRR